MTELLSQARAAEILDVQPRTLERWRARGCGPCFIRMGTGPCGRIVYRLSDLDAFLGEYGSSDYSDPRPRGEDFRTAAVDTIIGRNDKVSERLRIAASMSAANDDSYLAT